MNRNSSPEFNGSTTKFRAIVLFLSDYQPLPV
jgi:hypothetical protein